MREQFLAAVRCHQSGRLGEAERLYRNILAVQPRHADALHLLGVIATQRGDHQSAVTLIDQAIAENSKAPPFHANRGTSLRALGRLAEAAEAFRLALKLKPDYAEAHNNLGATWRDLGRADEAEASFRRALRYRPDFADAHNNLGNLLRESGRPAEAEAALLEALRLTPADHPKLAHYQRNLAVLLRDLGRAGEAEAAFRLALRQLPQDADAHLNLGIVLQEMGWLDEAIERFRVAILLAPGRPSSHQLLGSSWRAAGRLAAAETALRRALAITDDQADSHGALATLLRELGRLDEADHHRRRALSLQPDQAACHYNLAMTRRYRADDPHIAELERLADAAGRPAGDRIQLHFALGKAYEDVGRPADAFAQFLLGNRLKRGQLDYDEAATMARFAAITAAFDAVTLAAAGTAPASGPIFILGMPRSGSTLVEQILASHPLLFGAGEMNLLKQAIHRQGGDDPKVAARLDPAQRAALAADYLAALAAEAPAGSRITDKYLHNFLDCGVIALCLPQARIIHMRRDPVDCCLSAFSKLFVGQHAYAYDLAELGRYYRAYLALMRHWRRALPAGLMLDVDYEAVVADLEGQTRRILAHCGLAWDAACLDFHRSARPVRTASALQVRQPIYRGSVGRWRPPAEQLAPLTAALGDLSSLL